MAGVTRVDGELLIMKVRALIAVLLLSASGSLFGQAPEISDEQLEIFKSLPPDQQEALMEELLRSRESGDRASDSRDREQRTGRDQQQRGTDRASKRDTRET